MLRAEAGQGDRGEGEGRRARQAEAAQQEERAEDEQGRGARREGVAGGEEPRAGAEEPGVEREHEGEEARAAVDAGGVVERAVEGPAGEVVGERHPGARDVVQGVAARPRRRQPQRAREREGRREPGQEPLRPADPRGARGGRVHGQGSDGAAEGDRRDRKREIQPAGSQPRATESPR